jgi:hypothetical protein
MAEVVVGRLNGIETVLLDLDGTCRWAARSSRRPRDHAVAAGPGPDGAVHHQHRRNRPGRPGRPPGPARLRTSFTWPYGNRSEACNQGGRIPAMVWSPSGGNEPVSAPRSWVHDFNRAVRGNMASAPFGRTLRLVGQADLGVRIAGLKGWSRSVTVTRQGLGKVPECQVHRLVMPRRAPGRWDGRALLTTRTLRSATCTRGVQHAGDAAHARLAGGTRLRMWW